MRSYPSICWQILLLFSTFVLPVAPQTKRDCPESCGNLNIPYPFGIGEGCYLNEDFSVTCNLSSTPPKAFLGSSFNIEIVEINSVEGQLSLLGYIAQDCKDNSSVNDWDSYFTFSNFTISKSKNRFTVIGCDSYGYLDGFIDNNYTKYYKSGCTSFCERSEDVDDTSCSGSGCCQTEIRDGLSDIYVSASSKGNYKNVSHFSPCTYAFVVEESKFNFSRRYLKNMSEQLPIAVDWSVNETITSIADACQENSKPDKLKNGGFRCMCEYGYEGNPYRGCYDIDECKDMNSNNCTHHCKNISGNYTCSCPKWSRGDGRRDGKGCVLHPLPIILTIIGVGVTLIVAFVAGIWIYLTLKQKRDIKLKERFFRENGGFLLQQKLSRQEGMSSSITFFTVEQLEKATSSYDESMILGRGGYGTVYKGVFTDNREVAIKRSTSLDHTQVEQFVNEVLILSQINHRNVVRLVGCCLETEVPMLVYEFISNGTLFEHIHEKDKSSFPWEMRLKIAAETAGALTYLHSAASVPIIHRDVKTTNILLGPDYTAKVSDFGTSKFVPQDEIQISTMVQGTLGYLDPEYLLTSQLSDKSDVYSFGVVLVELLTRLKPISFARPEAQRSLAMHFVLSIKHDSLFDIIDSELIDQGKDDQLKEVALLANRCLTMKGEKRPSMKEVAMQLEGLLLMAEKHPSDEVNLEETEHLLLEHSRTYGYDGGVTSTSIVYNSLKDQVVLSIGCGR